MVLGFNYGHMFRTKQFGAYVDSTPTLPF